MTDTALPDTEPKKRRSWRLVALVAIFSVLGSIGFTVAADSWGDSFTVRGGGWGSSMVRCGGGMSRLAHPYAEGYTTVFPGDPEVMVDLFVTYDTPLPGGGTAGYVVENITAGTHGGTHLDAPSHFIMGARSIDQIEATEFVWPAYIIDVRDRVLAEGPDFELEKADIRDYERHHGRIKDGSMVIIYTGHDALFGTSAYTNTSHPGFSGEAVTWMFDKRDIGGLGSDGLGPDASSDFEFDATYQALLNDGLTMPGLNNLSEMNIKGDIIIASAVPLVNGSGFVTDPLACHGY